jgi:subfamily B ATP-binding cassette protein MsbA
LVTDNVIRIVHNVATILMMLCLMIYYAPQMTAVLVILIPGIIVPLIIITRKRNVLTRTGFGAEADSITHIAQSIEGVKTIQAFCNEDQESHRMNEIEDTRVSVHFKSAKLQGIQTPILETMISVGLCAALLVGGYFITSGAITTGDFTAFLLALTAAYQPAKSLTGVNGGIQAGLIAAEGLFGFIDREAEIADSKDAVDLDRSQMEVKLDHISFAYNPADGEILHDVSLTVSPGKTCALVGPSGGGKSTIFNLLERFYDPQVGAVRINGQDIRKYTLKSLRQNIANVSQDVFLFNGTIADNIKYGNPNATTEQIQAAAKAANAHDFIMEFPHRYDNLVGERGSLLSGGQKQRIAIARAILKDAPILLLDEATSALDTQSEKLIQQALKKLMSGRTTFVIAHRLTTILDADTICVVKDGRIVEMGTDAELTALGGEYKKLKDAQFSEVKHPE